jgi:cold shock protein
LLFHAVERWRGLREVSFTGGRLRRRCSKTANRPHGVLGRQF